MGDADRREREFPRRCLDLAYIELLLGDVYRIDLDDRSVLVALEMNGKKSHDSPTEIRRRARLDLGRGMIPRRVVYETNFRFWRVTPRTPRHRSAHGPRGIPFASFSPSPLEPAPLGSKVKYKCRSRRSPPRLTALSRCGSVSLRCGAAVAGRRAR